MLLAVTPLTISDSSCQLRPCSGSSAIWRRSMLPATCDERTSTIGAWPLTVTDLLDAGQLHRHRRHGGVGADQKLDVGDLGGREPGHLDPDRVLAGGQVLQTIAAFLRRRRRPTGGRCPPRSRSRWHPAARHAARRRPRPEPSRSAAQRDTWTSTTRARAGNLRGVASDFLLHERSGAGGGGGRAHSQWGAQRHGEVTRACALSFSKHGAIAAGAAPAGLFCRQIPRRGARPRAFTR